MGPQTQDVLTSPGARKVADISEEQLHLQLDGERARWTCWKFWSGIHATVLADA